MSVNGILSSTIGLDAKVHRGRWDGALRGFALVYLAVSAIALFCVEWLRSPASSSACAAISNWIALPLQISAAWVTTTMAWRMSRSGCSERVVWQMIAAFCIQNLLACYVWVAWRTQGSVASFTSADLNYLIDYWLLAVVYGWLFVRNGGTFRHPRVWMDAIAIFATLLTVFWIFLLSATGQSTGGYGPSLSLFLPYTLSLVAMMTMAALLWMQLADFRRRPVEVLLIVAGLAEVVFEIIWLAGWRHNIDFAGAFYNFGDVICFTAIVLASTYAGPARARDSAAPRSTHAAHTFLPTLAALLSLALVAGTLASTRASNAWILVGLVVVSAMLLVTRHRAAMQEITALNHALAMQAADVRLTELARQSTDLFLVVDRSGRINYASPAALAIVGTPQERLTGDSLVHLFGASHEPVLSAFIAELAARPDAHAAIEISLTFAAANGRVLRFSGANRLDNPHIHGLTVTVSDISEQRFLERAVLDAANQERLRLASDLHDGLGQELTGISMLLQSAANSPRYSAAATWLGACRRSTWCAVH